MLRDQPMQVLVCDYDASTRTAVRRLLEERFACIVHECGDGFAALQKLSRGKYAFVILELEMPMMDGLDTLRELRSAAATCNVPVIVVSDQRDETVILKLVRLGIADFLVKPVEPQALVGKIEKLVRMLPRKNPQPLVAAPGPLASLSSLVPELRDIVGSAVSQVFSMMFDAEVEPSVDNSPLEVAYSSSVEIAVDDRFLMTVALHMPRAAAASTASWMVGLSPADVGDEDCLSVAGELGNMVAGRAHARFRERAMQSVCALPKTRSGYTLPTVGDRNGFRLRFSLPGSGDFVLAVTVFEAVGVATARAERALAKKENVSSVASAKEGV